MTAPNKCAQHRPAGHSDRSGELRRDGCNRWAFPAAVAEFVGRKKQ